MSRSGKTARDRTSSGGRSAPGSCPPPRSAVGLRGILPRHGLLTPPTEVLSLAIFPILPGLLPLLIVVTVLAIGGCSRKAPAVPPRVPVTVARAETRAVPWALDANGTVEPVKSVAVLSQVGGAVVAVRFDEGQEVGRGQVLFEIDPRPFQAALQAAHANLGRDEVQAATARRDAERYRVLADSGFVTQEDYQAKESAAGALRAVARGDSAALAIAKLNLEHATVRAPIAGRTGRLLVHEGALVKASGDSLVTIVQLRPIDIRFAIPARNLPDVLSRRGETLRVVASPPGAAALDGALSFVDNAVDLQTGTVTMKGRFANDDGLLWPGQFVPVTLILDTQRDATVIPSRAIVNGQQGTYVFVVTADGKAATRPVTVARTVDTLAVIADGLTPGVDVVTDGQLRLTPNSIVDVRGGAAGQNATPKGDSAPAGSRP